MVQGRKAPLSLPYTLLSSYYHPCLSLEGHHYTLHISLKALQSTPPHFLCLATLTFTSFTSR